MTARPTPRRQRHRAPSTRRGAVLLTSVLLVVAAGLGPAVTRADAIPFGGNAQVTPNVGFGCEAGFRLGDAAGNYFVLPSGVPSCSYFQVTPLTTAAGTAPAPRGRVTLVRVRTGDDPAPLRFTVMQARSGLDAQGRIIPGSTQCCFGEQMTRTFTFAPNTVTAVPLNLPIVNDRFPDRRLAITDYVGFSADSGTGALPILVTSAPAPPNQRDFAQGNNPGVTTLYPQISPQEVRVDSSSAPSLRLTTEFTFCTSGLGTSGRALAERQAARALPSACGGKVLTSAVRVRRGAISVPVRCVGACSGTIDVTRARGKGALGVSRSFALRTGGKDQVVVRLTRAGRKATRGARTVRATVVLRTQGTRSSRTVRLR